ncbi:MAG TPA: hypothetical protein VD884_15225 [Ohtaekwangia sp.]|nr:hypothetical protein [Ohtaekwangia sp.]
MQLSFTITDSLDPKENQIFNSGIGFKNTYDEPTKMTDKMQDLTPEG